MQWRKRTGRGHELRLYGWLPVGERNGEAERSVGLAAGMAEPAGQTRCPRMSQGTGSEWKLLVVSAKNG